MRQIPGTLLTLMAALAFPTMAQKPTIQMAPFPAEGIVAPTASVCGFNILAVPAPGTPNKAKLILFEGGSTGIATGPLTLTLTNLSTGKTVDVKSNSAGHLTISSVNDITTVVAAGPTVIAFPPAPASVAAAAGLPQAFLIDGRLVFTEDAQGDVLSIQSFTGQVQDLCQLLR